MIKIDFACPQKWDSMSGAGDSLRHCSECSKNVRDFTKTSEKADGSMDLQGAECGRFRLDQVNKVKHQFSLSKTSLYATSLLAAMGVSSTINTVQAQSTEKTIQHEKKKKSEVGLKGLVKSKITNEPLPFVEVDVKVGKELLCGTTTDHEGKFTLMVDTTGVDFNSIFLEFYGTGYKNDTLHLLEIANELLDKEIVIDLETSLMKMQAKRQFLLGFVVTGDVDEMRDEEDSSDESDD